MLTYDPDRPLVFIHTPKTAGTSIQLIFEKWFGKGLLLHYYKEALCEMPIRHEIFANHTKEQPIVVYGHFNRRRNFGVEDYYPEARQFITILRDPLERLISNYFYLKKVARGWKKHADPIDPDLENYLLTNKSTMLNYFPREVTFDNYKEIIEKYFIEIGTIESIEQSMQSIACKLHKPYDAEMLEHKNTTPREEQINDKLRSVFAENNELEYIVFDYIRNKHSTESQSFST